MGDRQKKLKYYFYYNALLGSASTSYINKSNLGEGSSVQVTAIQKHNGICICDRDFGRSQGLFITSSLRDKSVDFEKPQTMVQQ